MIFGKLLRAALVVSSCLAGLYQAPSASAGEVLVADRLSNSVYRYSDTGTYLGPLLNSDSHLNQPTGIQVSPDKTKLYVSSSQTNSVIEYNYNYSAGTATYSKTITDNLNFPSSILFNADGSKFYVSNFFKTVGNVVTPVGVAQFNADGTSAGPNLVGGQLLSASGLAWASTGQLLVGGFSPGMISESDPALTSLADFMGPTAGLSGMSGLYSEGNNLYATAMFASTLYKFDETTKATLASVSGISFPQAIMGAPDGNGILVGILGVANGAGSITHYSSDLTNPTVWAPAGVGFTEATSFIHVPEPSSLVLAGFAALGLALLGRARRPMTKRNRQ
jgi:DNA-binding beta-propeller fold protein YncE